MSEQNLTDALIALANGWASVDETRKAVRTYVAGEMRKVVPEIQVPPAKYDSMERYGIACHNQCRATTLANIATYEKEQEDGK